MELTKNVIHEEIDNFEKFKSLPGLKVVLFSAPWLPNHEVQFEHFVNFFEKEKDKIWFGYEDISKNQENALAEQIRVFPTTLIINNDGIIIENLQGVISESVLENKLSSV